MKTQSVVIYTSRTDPNQLNEAEIKDMFQQLECIQDGGVISTI